MDRIRTAILWSLWPAALAGLILIANNPATGQDDGDGAANEAGLQELTRGPIHEAFAEPVVFNPKPGLVVKKEPPKPIEELPPDQKPEGDNVAFIAGYFSFDEDKDDFFYVSGIWRMIPPGKEWVGGYWIQMDAGWQWVSGHWKSVSEVVADAPVNEGGPVKNQVEYYPEPPPSLENGANTDAPTEDHVWVPGCHTWYGSRFVWRGGYWVGARADWMWVPAHYVWSPCGYVFVEGYWDRTIAHRGVIFAPCYIEPVVYRRARFVYCPRLVIDIGIVTDHFFCRPSYGHYYFGDYYANSYVSVGISPWFSFHYGRGHHCPIYSHHRWTHARRDTRWEVDLRENYRHRVAHIEHRPARTYVQQTTIINNITVNKNVNVNNVNVNKMALAKPLNQVVKQPADSKGGSPIRFEKVNQVDRQLLASKATDVRKGSLERSGLEAKAAKDLKTSSAAAGAGNLGASKPLTLNLPKSTVVSKPTDKLTKTNAPPPIPPGGLIKPSKTGGDTTGKPGTTGPVTGGASDTKKPTGPTGTGGATDTKKPTGPTGTGGATDTKKPTGPTGTGGASDTKKPTGPTGTGGATDTKKPTGPTGPTGTGGASDTKKPTGPTGTGGASDTKKPTGPTGPTGTGGATDTKKPTGPTGGGGASDTKKPTGPTGGGASGGSKPPTGGGSSVPPSPFLPSGGASGGSKPPTSGGSGVPPSGGASGGSKPPTTGGSSAPPSGGGSKPPTSGGSSSGGSKPPTTGGSSTPPSGSGSGKPPAGGKDKGKDR